MESFEKNNAAEMNSLQKTVLRTEHLSISFGGLRAVDDVNLNIKYGDLYGLIGPNGAGKTTVFNILTGVYKPTSGRFFLEDTDLTGKSPLEINRAGIARTFQNIRLFAKMSVIDNVKVGIGNQIKCFLPVSMLRLPNHFKTERQFNERAAELLHVFKLDNFAEYKAANLPYGKQRQLEIARALATNPKLLLLDEPAAGMNPSETQDLMNVISYIRKEMGVTILLIEHDMKLVSGICEHVTVLNFGTELAKGKTTEALNNPEVIKAYLGN